MARIIGAIATSHTPTIGFAYDTNKGADPVWKPIFEAYEPIRAWLAEKRPDALLIIYNDHVTSFFFDHYSAFCLGIGESYPVDCRGKQRKHPAEPAVADVIGQRHRGVADLGREQFDQECRDRAVHHRDVDHHDEEDQLRHQQLIFAGSALVG